MSPQMSKGGGGWFAHKCLKGGGAAGELTSV